MKRSDIDTILIAGGDEKAFKKFIEFFSPACWRYAYRILRKEELAEEAGCDVFVAVWDARRHLPVIESIEAWLHRLTLNKAISILRKESRWAGRKEDITDIEMNIPDSAEEHGYDRDMIRRLNEAVQGLPEKCRHVLYLAKIEKLSYKEISMILDISVKTVGNHLSYAMKKLTAALNGNIHINVILLGLAVWDTFSVPVRMFFKSIPPQF